MLPLVAAAFSFVLTPILHSNLLVEGPPIIVAVEDLLARLAALAASTTALDALRGWWRLALLVDYFIRFSYAHLRGARGRIDDPGLVKGFGRGDFPRDKWMSL